MRVATFNVQNLRLRGEGGKARLDGARDMDEPGAEEGAATPFDRADRRLTAAVLAGIDADVVALQEVFDAATLDFFHDRDLLAAGARPYPHRICLPGNDGAGRDVALMSRIKPHDIASHVDVTPAGLGLDGAPPDIADRPIFRRDCLVADVDWLTLFVCHFKAPWPDARIAWTIRNLEAQAVRRLIERRFADPAAALWLVIGDLNEPRRRGGEPDGSLAPLAAPFSIDLVKRLPEADRWSYFEPEREAYLRPDGMLASPALAARFPDVRPRFVRAGLARQAAEYRGERLAGVGVHRPHASDHAALVVDLVPDPSAG